MNLFEKCIIIGMCLLIIGIAIGTAKGFNTSNINCNHTVYPKNFTRTIEIMKYCTDGEKETK